MALSVLKEFLWMFLYPSLSIDKENFFIENIVVSHTTKDEHNLLISPAKKMIIMDCHRCETVNSD